MAARAVVASVNEARQKAKEDLDVEEAREQLVGGPGSRPTGRGSRSNPLSPAGEPAARAEPDHCGLRGQELRRSSASSKPSRAGIALGVPECVRFSARFR